MRKKKVIKFPLPSKCVKISFFDIKHDIESKLLNAKIIIKSTNRLSNVSRKFRLHNEILKRQTLYRAF
jgi:hypothetical protein